MLFGSDLTYNSSIILNKLPSFKNGSNEKYKWNPNKKIVDKTLNGLCKPNSVHDTTAQKFADFSYLPILTISAWIAMKYLPKVYKI